MRFSLQTGPSASPTPPSAPTGDLPSLSQASPRRKSGVLKALGLLTVIAGVAVAVVIGVGVPGVKRSVSGLFASTKSDVIIATVRPTKLSVIVKEKGNLESAANKDVLCGVEGGTTIISIKPEGTPVKAGDVVAELDSAALSDSLINQRITTQQAEASFKQAKLVREVAEYAVKEYEQGLFLQELATDKGQIALAKSDRERAIDRLKWSTEMMKKGYVSIATNIADQLTKQQADFDLEQAQTQLNVLEKYTYEKQVKSLKSDVEKAKADELSKQSSWTLEQTKEKKLERQIAACTLRAPGDGIVVYANDPGRMGGQQAVQIEEGASVRERQKIFSLPDMTKMRVNTKVHESMVDRIKVGRPALIRVDAAVDQVLKGTVASVAPMSDANSAFASDIKVYTTFVSLQGDTTTLNLRPGMSAQVEILVEELPDVLTVPVQAILQFKDKDWAFVKDGDGFRKQELTLGVSNDQHVEVKKGLSDGDQVAMTPTMLLTEDEKREAYSIAAKDAAKKDFGPDASVKGVMPKGVGIEGADGESKAKKKKGAGGGGGNPLMQKLSPEDRQKFFSASPEEKMQMLKDAGASDADIEAMMERMRNGGGGGGRGGAGGGRGGPGGGAGGFGGGAGGPGQ
jgi:HlyD family secretion protein